MIILSIFTLISKIDQMPFLEIPRKSGGFLLYLGTNETV